MGTFATGGNYRAADPRLVAIAQAAAANSPYNVVLFSGERGGNGRSQHSGGNAVDIVLIDPRTGREIPNLGAGGASFDAYQTFAQTMRATQQQIAPELSNTFRWGGYFGPTGLNPTGLDLMHFDLGPTANMALGSWDRGLNERGRTFVAQAGSGRTYSASQGPGGSSTSQPMAYAGSQSTPAGQAAIDAATGPGQDVTAPTPAPGSQRLFMPIRDAIAARQAGGTPRLDELRNIREQRMAGNHPLLDRFRNFLQTIGHPAAQENAPTPPAPIPNVRTGGSRSDPAVAQLQQELAAAGFDPGAIDGIMGPRTQAAMQARDAAGGIGAPGQSGGLPRTGPASTVAGQQAKGFGLFDAVGRNLTGSGQQQVAGPAGSKTPVPLPQANPMRGAPAPASYNAQAPLNYGLPITPQGPAQISAPAPGSLTTGSLTPTGPSGFGSYNPAASLNFGIPISPTGPQSVPTPSVNRNLGPMLAGYDTPGNGVGVPTTPVSRGVLPAAAPAPNPAAGIDIAGILAGMQQAGISMPGWGPSAGPTSGPGAGGRPVMTQPTTTVPSQQWNIPGERERAMNNGLMPAGRDNFAASNGQFRYLPAFSDPNPMTFLPNGLDGPSRAVQSTSPPMEPGIPHRGIPVAEYWRRLLTGAGV